MCDLLTFTYYFLCFFSGKILGISHEMKKTWPFWKISSDFRNCFSLPNACIRRYDFPFQHNLLVTCDGLGGIFDSKWYTRDPETNSKLAPKNGWLEDDRGILRIFGRCKLAVRTSGFGGKSFSFPKELQHTPISHTQLWQSPGNAVPMKGIPSP